MGGAHLGIGRAWDGGQWLYMVPGVCSYLVGALGGVCLPWLHWGLHRASRRGVWGGGVCHRIALVSFLTWSIQVTHPILT